MDQVLDAYLDRIDRHLRPKPASERVDIVQEIRSELLELEAQGLSPQAITARLGEPRELAMAYLSDAIMKNPRFSWRRLGSVAAFYSLAGLGGLIVLPATSITAVAFLICGAAVPAMCLLKLLGSLVGIEMPWIAVQFGTWTAPPAAAFLVSVGVGLLLLLAGMWLWRFTIRFIRTLAQNRPRRRG